MVALIDLPPELLYQIISHLELARDVSRLSHTCRKAHSIIAKDGYRVFVHNRFPSIQFPVPIEYAGSTGPFFKDAAHALTTLSRNWDRKAFIARSIWTEPSNGQKGRRPGHKQTMGFTPVIHSYEAWHGGDWSSRRQVVAWGAGSEVILSSSDLEKLQRPEAGEHELSHLWKKREVYREKGVIEGRDDVTSVQLLSPLSSTIEDFVVGRASGLLARVSFDTQGRKFKRHVTYDTSEQSIKCASTNSEGLLTACLATRCLAFYDSKSEEPTVAPISRFELGLSENSGQSWVCCFLRDDLVAVGFGPSATPVQLFNVGNSGISQRQSISAMSTVPCSSNQGESTQQTSVYSLATVSPSSQAGGQQGDLFLSGGYDGVVRLHDLRCANRVAATFEDSIDSSAVYSLVSYGRERFVAGAARDALLKVFDLRLPGSKRYYGANLQSCYEAAGAFQDHAQVGCRDRTYVEELYQNPCGWNAFLGARPFRKHGYGFDTRSPLYSLSSPSAFSPTLFAGIEGQVLQIDLVSIMDKFPDSVYGAVPNSGNRAKDIKVKWNPYNKVTRVPAYQHPTSDRGSVKLKTQRPVDRYEGKINGWDERWDWL